MLSVAHLTKAFGSRLAVRDVSFELGRGVTGLLGPNGAGKTTLVRCLAGLTGWDTGEIRIGEIDPARRPADARRSVGYMPERVAFPAEMRVEAYLRFAAELKGIPRSTRSAVIETALRRVGLEGARTRIVGNLSKGYRQRVGLAQALLTDPSVVLLDEPTAGLDPLNVTEIRGLLEEYAAGRAVLISTHVLSEALLVCDRVVVMSKGRIVYDGSTMGMLQAGAERLRVRIRLRPPVPGDVLPRIDDTSGVRVLHQQADGEGHRLLVEAAAEAAVGRLARDLSVAGWLVVGIEPAAGALEEAFRAAVVGADEVGVQAP